MALKRQFLALFLLSVLAFAHVWCDADDSDNDEKDADKVEATAEEEDGVLVLTDDNFDDVVYSKDTILVEFYAPWCGHCKSLAPEYAAAAKTLKEKDPPVPLAKVDATVQTKVAERFEVQGYPTLKFFKNGRPFDYEGPRSKEGIVSYMLEKADPKWAPPPSAVVRLTKDNFTEFVETQELCLVYFFAPWCGHCKALTPKYEKAARALANIPFPVPLAMIDATVNYDIASQLNVTGYPTLKIFRKGRASTYKGQREEQAIVQYMMGQIGEAAKLIDSPKTLKEATSGLEVTVVGFFEKEDDFRLRIFQDAANDLRDDFRFGYCLCAECRQQHSLQPGAITIFPVERLHTKYEPKLKQLDKKEYSVDDVVQFVQTQHFPLVGEYNSKTSKFYDEKRPLCLIFYTVDWSFDHREATKLWQEKIAKIAKDYPAITFAIANEEDHQHHIKDFGLETSPEEMNIGILGADKKKYPMEPMEEFDSDEIREFLDKFQKGKIAAKIRSEPAPKKQGVVTKVVGTTFDSIVMDPSKDVLIEFYAPWCGHCKKLEPVYKELGKKYKAEKEVVIAKMDATANEVPESFQVQGFPTIYLVPSAGDPVPFQGERTLDGLAQFLELNSPRLKKAKAKEEL